MSRWAATTAHKFLQFSNGTVGTYNLHDTYNTARLGLFLRRRLGELGGLEFYLRELKPLVPAVLNMQARGLAIDRDRLNYHRARVRGELAEADAAILAADPSGRLAEPTDTYPNGINSSRRLARFLFEDLGLRSGKKTDTGLDSTDQEALARVLRDLRKRDEPCRPVLESLFHRTRLATIQKRYLHPQIDSDGCVRPRVKITGTKTLRFAYSEPAMQQFPLEIRDYIVARPGYCFLSRDHSQLEPRLMTYIFRDTASMAVFEAGGDIYSYDAADCFDTPLERLPKDDPKRTWTKGFRLGTAYGGQAETMKTKMFCPCPRCRHLIPPTLVLTKNQIRAAQDRWHSRHPEILVGQREIADAVRRTGVYRHPLGYRRHFAKRWGPELDREVKNIPMQLGAAILMNRSQVRLDGMGAPIVLQHHDEFLLEVPTDRLDTWIEITQRVMETPVPELDNVTFPTEYTVGFNWGPRSAENPRGMGKGLPDAA